MLPGRLHEGRGNAAPREMVATGASAGTESGLQAGSSTTLMSISMAQDEEAGKGETHKCPVCGQGTLVEISFTEHSAMEAEAGEAIQEADTRQVESYSCGHEVVGPRLDESAVGTEDLQVEHRQTDETAEPL